MKLLQVPATISKITSMSNRTLRCQVDTQENLSDEELAKIIGNIDKFGWFTFSPDNQIDEEDLLDLPSLPKRAEEEKSPAQKLHNTLYVYWKQEGAKGEWEIYYRRYMDKRINEIKERLL